MLHGSRRGVLISYARGDGEEAATKLREDLERHAPDIGIVWQDRDRLEAGVDWWQQIAQAIDSVEFLALVMTPLAMKSQVVRREWEYARQQGVCVYPLISGPQLDFGSLPRWMAKAHFHHLPKEWPALLQHLRSPCRANRVRSMAPDLPAHHVKRPAEFNLLRDSLLDSGQNGAATTTVIRGAGGFGKTTVAAAICHDPAIQNAFDDGILWVTLGQNPDVVAGLTLLFAALTGNRPSFASEEDAAYQLAERLQESRCLIVVDDVWNNAHSKPFLRGARSCARLITTRLHEVSPESRHVWIGAMEESQATEMLGFGADQTKLARRLGKWPLLLELARSTLQQLTRSGESQMESLAYLNQALDEEGIQAFDHHDPVHRNQAIRASMEVSLRLLSQDERWHYQKLAIFPEDVDVPFNAVRALWGITDFQTKKLLNLLEALSLLTLRRESATLRLHDVIRTWLGEQIAQPEPLHSLLVDAWSDRYHLPNEYAWRWLAYHLVGAGRRDELRQLLLDVQWMRAKLSASDVTALANDYKYLPPDSQLQPVQAAILLSAHVISKDARQLPGQLLGRLPETACLSNLDVRAGTAELRPMTATLSRVGGALIRTLTGHTGAVSAVALTRDATRAVSASADNTLKYWDLETGLELATLTGHTNAVNAVAVTVDGRRAISASWDHTLKVWDLESGKELATLTGHTDSVDSVAVTADGLRAVSSASLESTSKVWDLATGRELHSLEGGGDLAVTAGGKLYASQGDELTIWDLGTLRKLAKLVLAGHYFARAVTVFSNGSRALSVGGDARLTMWNLESGRELASWIAYRSNADMIKALAVTPDGRRAASASNDNTVKIWDLERQYTLATLEGHAATVNDVAITPDGRRALSASADGTLKLWSLESGREFEKGEFTLPGSGVWVTAIAAAGKRAVSAWVDNSETYEWYQGYSILRIWDLESGREKASLWAHSLQVRAMSVIEGGQRAVSASEDRTLKLWDLESGREVATLSGHTSWINGMAVTEDGSRAVSASADHTLRVWDLASGSELAILTGHEQPVSAVAMTADGRLAVSASWDHTLKVWELASGRELATLRDHTAPVFHVALTADGTYAISASADGILKIWNLASEPKAIATIVGENGTASLVTIPGDGLRAVSVEGDRLRVWDLRSGRELAACTGHTRAIAAVAVAPDGRRAVSVSHDHTVKVWDLESGREVATFSTDDALYCCAFAQEGRTIIAGGAAGHVHILKLWESPSTLNE